MNMQIDNKPTKRLIVCCDGTWQNLDNDCPTNVLRIAQAIKPIAKGNNEGAIPQILYYDAGIGTVQSTSEGGAIQRTIEFTRNFAEKIGGGAFGWWIGNKIKEAYIFLCLNYTPGDEIYLFGFSRGAYTVRSLVGLINCSGLLQRPNIGKSSQAHEIYRIIDKHEREREGEKFRQENNAEQVGIKLLGCWDTVGALGIPDFLPWIHLDRKANKKYQFHNTELSPIIQNARHAIAVDERRKVFDVTHMNMKPTKDSNCQLRNMWFPGDHGCVGGGTKETLGLSNAALKWMAEEASKLGLELDLQLSRNSTEVDHRAPFCNKSRIPGNFGMHVRKLPEETAFDDIHPSVKSRWQDLGEKYRPSNLRKFAEWLNKN